MNSESYAVATHIGGVNVVESEKPNGIYESSAPGENGGYEEWSVRLHFGVVMRFREQTLLRFRGQGPSSALVDWRRLCLMPARLK